MDCKFEQEKKYYRKSIVYTNYANFEKDLFKLNDIVNHMYGMLNRGGFPDTKREGADKHTNSMMKIILLDVLKHTKKEFDEIEKELDEEERVDDKIMEDKRKDIESQLRMSDI